MLMFQLDDSVTKLFIFSFTKSDPSSSNLFKIDFLENLFSKTYTVEKLPFLTQSILRI